MSGWNSVLVSGASVIRKVAPTLLMALALVVVQAVAGKAQGPPGIGESICAEAGFTGAALGLCRAYCEAQDCGVWERPSCEPLRAMFEETVGIAMFPCDPFCGDGEVNQDIEECDPPASVCEPASLGVCSESCACVMGGDPGSTGDERGGERDMGTPPDGGAGRL